MNFGIFVKGALMSIALLSAASASLHRLFSRASNQEVACLARLWLDDKLGRNSESRTPGIIPRQLRRHQSTIKAVVASSDPKAGRTRTIYRGAGVLSLVAGALRCRSTSSPMAPFTIADRWATPTGRTASDISSLMVSGSNW